MEKGMAGKAKRTDIFSKVRTAWPGCDASAPLEYVRWIEPQASRVLGCAAVAAGFPGGR